MQIVRTETDSGGPTRTPREEIVAVFNSGDRVEPDQAIDGSESEGWTEPPEGSVPTTWTTQMDAVKQFVIAAEMLDTEAKGEQAGGSDDKGGIYSAFFNNEVVPIGVGDDDGDLNSSNFDRKVQQVEKDYGLPAGGTVVMGAIQLLDEHYMGEFERDEDTGQIVPVAKRPKRARVLWTDGAMRDADKFGRRLEEDHSDRWPSEDWFVAILGHGTAHDATLKQYQEIAQRHANVHVYSFEDVVNAAEIAEDMAIAVLGHKAS